MTDADRTQPLQERLKQFGDPRESCDWSTGDPDYVATLGPRGSDIPLLIHTARQWAEPFDWPEDEADTSGYAPIHAWRCLAQLRSEQAVGPLLEMLDPLDAGMDDWYLEEFPYVFAWIGAPAVPALRSYLADSSHGVYARVCVAHGLCEVARRHVDVRDEVVKALCQILTEFEKNDDSLNAFLVSYLMQLGATDAAESIERAYAADRVDVGVVGNWNKVRQELGVDGLGLVPEDLAGQRAWPLILPSAQRSVSSGSSGQSRKHHRAKRKRQRQNRKRNRKR